MWRIALFWCQLVVQLLNLYKTKSTAIYNLYISRFSCSCVLIYIHAWINEWMHITIWSQYLFLQTRERENIVHQFRTKAMHICFPHPHFHFFSSLSLFALHPYTEWVFTLAKYLLENSIFILMRDNGIFTLKNLSLSNY